MRFSATVVEISRTLIAKVCTAWRNMITHCSSQPMSCCSWLFNEIARWLLISRSFNRRPNFEKTSPANVQRSMMFSFEDVPSVFDWFVVFVVVVVAGILLKEINSRRMKLAVDADVDSDGFRRSFFLFVISLFIDRISYCSDN